MKDSLLVKVAGIFVYWFPIKPSLSLTHKYTQVCVGLSVCGRQTHRHKDNSHKERQNKPVYICPCWTVLSLWRRGRKTSCKSVMVVNADEKTQKYQEMVADQDKRKTEIKYQEGEDGVAPFLQPCGTVLAPGLCSTSPVCVTEDGPTGAQGYDGRAAGKGFSISSLLPLVKVRKGDGGTCTRLVDIVAGWSDGWIPTS